MIEVFGKRAKLTEAQARGEAFGTGGAGCTCWIGTSATSGDSDQRAACKVHGEKPASAGTPVPFVCPFCGGYLQITLQYDRDVSDKGNVWDVDAGQSFVLYCANDCDEWHTSGQSNDFDGDVPSRARILDVLTWYAQQGGK